MKGFIELHDYYDHKPILIAVKTIVQAQAFFVSTVAAGFNVEEDYTTICALIAKEAADD